MNWNSSRNANHFEENISFIDKVIKKFRKQKAQNNELSFRHEK